MLATKLRFLLTALLLSTISCGGEPAAECHARCSTHLSDCLLYCVPSDLPCRLGCDAAYTSCSECC